MSGGGGKPMRGRMTLGTAAPKGTSGAADAKAAAAELRDAEQQLEKLNQVRMHAWRTPHMSAYSAHAEGSWHVFCPEFSSCAAHDEYPAARRRCGQLGTRSRHVSRHCGLLRGS